MFLYKNFFHKATKDRAAPQGTASYTYNAAGQRSSMTLPGNRVVNYSYHPTGRVASITDWLGGTQNFSYDADGQLTAVVRPNNVSSNYGYDLAGRLNAISHTGSGRVLQQYGYTLDENGNRIVVVTPGGTENYTLDALSRLTQVAYPNGDTASYLPNLYFALAGFAILTGLKNHKSCPTAVSVVHDLSF